MQDKTGIATARIDPVTEKRLDKLKDLRISLTNTSPALQALVDTVSQTCGVPISLITLLDDERQWHKARTGIDIESIPICDSFCRYVIRDSSVMLVDNARLDERFMTNPLVTGLPGIESYAGATIELSDGFRVGAICAIGTTPRTWTEQDGRLLSNMAKVAARLIELEASERQIAEMAAELKVGADRAKRFDSFLAGLQEGVIIQDENSNILEANPSAAEALGLTLDQLLGRHSYDPRWKLIDPNGHPIPPEMQPSNQALRTGQPVTGFVLGVEQPDRPTRWISINSQPYFASDSDRPVVTATTFVDITEKREHELELVRQSEALAIAVRKAEAANVAKTAFLANMSHEIRTPLNGIVGVASILDRTDLTPEQSEMVALIRTSGQALGKLLDDTLDLSRIEADRLEISKEKFNLKSEIQAATDLFRISANEKGLDYQADFQIGYCNTVVGDAIRIRQIISNLVANAVKFTEKGQIRIRIRFQSTREPGCCMLRVTVSDTGIGFSKEQQKRLFNRFQQGDRSITRRYGGVGLGLAISQGLAKAMGGTIHARSSPGKGSVFLIKIPLDTADKPVAETGSSPLPALSDVNPLRILVAEDHPTNQRMLNIILSAAGCETVLVSNGEEAVRKFTEQSFDCLILDMHMPELDGISATSRIRNLPGGSDIPVIMLTADTSGQGHSAAKAVGIDVLLHKPVTAEDLLTAMQTSLNERRENTIS